MLVKYKSNIKEPSGYSRNRTRIKFKLVKRDGDTVTLQGKCQNGTTWTEKASIDEIKEI